MADLVVIGAGHAGREAALCGARMGMDTMLLTLNLESVALMSRSPSIGAQARAILNGINKSGFCREVGNEEEIEFSWRIIIYGRKK